MTNSLNIIPAKYSWNTVENEVLEKVPVTKFLGVCIDENLDWIEHIDFVKKKISGGIYALNSSKNLLSNANM